MQQKEGRRSHEHIAMVRRQNQWARRYCMRGWWGQGGETSWQWKRNRSSEKQTPFMVGPRRRPSNPTAWAPTGVLASARHSPPILLEPNSDILPMLPETQFFCFAWVPRDLATWLRSLFPHFQKNTYSTFFITLVTCVLLLKSREPTSNDQLATQVSPHYRGGMDTAEQNDKGLVFQAHWSEPQSRIYQRWVVGLWASYLTTSETHPFYLEMPLAQDGYETQAWFKQAAGMVLDKSLHSIQVHTLPSSLWVLPILHSKAQPTHPPLVAAAMVKIVCFLSPWVLLFNCFVLTHLKSNSQSGQSYNHGFGVSLGPFLWYLLRVH